MIWVFPKEFIAPKITADLIWLEIPLWNLKPIGAAEEIKVIGSLNLFLGKKVAPNFSITFIIFSITFKKVFEGAFSFA